MSAIPEAFSKQAYLKWHNTVVEPESDLETEISSTMKLLKAESSERLAKLANLLSRLSSFQLLSKKMNNEDVSDAHTEIQLMSFVQSPGYDNLFKSTESIIDKFWRKNRLAVAGTYVTSKNIKSEIGDLVRTSVVTSTFSYAENFSRSIIYWRDVVKELGINEVDYEDVVSISQKEEAKMGNGYFAHHVDVLYSDGLRVEIQIYSKMSEIWRHLSHKLYEKVRLGEDVTWGHGTAASRLVSLGHLLHLAECEVEYLKGSIQK
jgi:ppGpp synthetase/RelA/SpoT-type nucleotidyltranferase